MIPIYYIYTNLLLSRGHLISARYSDNPQAGPDVLADQMGIHGMGSLIRGISYVIPFKMISFCYEVDGKTRERNQSCFFHELPEPDDQGNLWVLVDKVHPKFVYWLVCE